MPQKHPIQKLLVRLKTNWPEAVSEESDIVLGIIRFNDLIRTRVDSVLSEFDLSRSSFEVLASVRSLPEPRALTPKELSEAILITTGGMTKVLTHLEVQGLIERIARNDDKRGKLVKLTPAGKHLVEQAMTAVAEQDKALFKRLDSMEEVTDLRREVLGALNKIEFGE